MNDWRRRSVLATAVAIPAGALASVTVADSSPRLEADWPSHRGSAGHARVVEDGHEFDGDALEAVWSAAHDGHVAVADDTVYTTTKDAVVALDADDGTLVWKNAHVEANTPSVDDERVFLTGTEVVALDRTDGTFRWRSDFGTDKPAVWQTVADDTVYVVSNDSLYALEPDGGSLRWDIDLVRADGSDDEYAFFPRTAAANGMVYAATDGAVLAYDPETGDEIWRNEIVPGRDATLHATAAAVAVTGSAESEGRLYDPETGVVIGTVDAERSQELTLGSDLYVARADRAYRGRSIGDAEIDWAFDVPDASNTAGPAVIGGDTVYVHGVADGGSDRTLIALDKRDGTEKWSVAERDTRVGPIRAISDETMYVSHDGDLVALRERIDEGDADDGDDGGEQDDEDDRSSEQPNRGGDERGGGDEDERSSDGTDDEGATDELGEDEDDGADLSPDDGDDTERGGDEPADGTETEGDGTETEATESDEHDHGESDDGTETDDAGENGGEDVGYNETESDDADDGLLESDAAEPDDANGATEADDDAVESIDDPGTTTDAADGMPGFTTGAGVLSGALGLEWLRRRASTEDELEN